MALRPRPPIWLSLLKDYWWLAGIVAGGIALWGNLPERVKKVEAGQASQQEELGAIRDETKEIQGYLKGQQALNERLAAQQQALPTPLPEPRTPASGHPGANNGQAREEARPVEELSDDGEVKEMRWMDEQGVKHHLCCDGTDCWTWDKQTKCGR